MIQTDAHPNSNRSGSSSAVTHAQTAVRAGVTPPSAALASSQILDLSPPAASLELNADQEGRPG
jgi:hypothetical protein